MRPNTDTPLRSLFLARVDVSGECWLWTGYRTRAGYGQLPYGTFPDGKRRQLLAHRVSWELWRGAVPEGMFVCHRCDTPPCIRPSHLFLGTPADNMRDRHEKGHYASGETHHFQQHPELLERIRGENHWTRRRQMGPTGRAVSLVRDIRRAVEAGESQRSVARRLGVSQTSVWSIVNRRIWADV